MGLQGLAICKIMLALTIIFFTQTILAVEVALIPVSPELNFLADQVIANMPKKSGITFLERSEINKILKERQLTVASLTENDFVKLNKTIHADLFVIITARLIEGKTKTAGIIIYNVRNGFRLLNAPLPSKNIVQDISKKIHNALTLIKQPHKQFFLSIVTVRDAGVPQQFKYLPAFIASSLELSLTKIPNVTVLERDYLASVNQERKLTGQYFNLTPTSRLIRMEFSPVDSSEKIALTISLTDCAGRNKYRFKIDDAFSSPNKTINSAVSNIAQQLRLKPPFRKGKSMARLRRAEARRYYNEYSFLQQYGDYESARKKLNSAIALNPRSMKYRLAMISLLQKSIARRPARKDFNFIKQLNIAKEALLICDELYQEFPKTNKIIYGNMRSLLFRMNYVWIYADSSERKKLSEFADNVRSKIQNENSTRYNFDLTNGINNIKELEEYRKYLFSTRNFQFYFDTKKYYDSMLNKGLIILRESASLFRQSPHLIPADIDRQYEIIAKEFGFAKIANGMEYFVINADSYITTAKNHPLKAARCIAYTLELCRKTVLSNYDEVIFRKNMHKYCSEINALKISHLPKNKRSNSSCTDYLLFLRVKQKRLLKISEEIAVKELQPVNHEEKLFRSVLAEQNLTTFSQKITALIVQLKLLRPQILIDADLAYYPDIFADRLYYGISQKNEDCAKALKMLMSGTTITPMVPHKKLLTASCDPLYTKIKSTAELNSILYLLVWQKDKNTYTKNKLSVLKFDPQKMSLEEVNSIAANQEYPSGTRGRWIFSVAENFALLGYKQSLFLLPLDGSPPYEIKDIPGRTVQAATVLNGRIYMFTSRLYRSGVHESFMISCRPDGTDRKIYVSTVRERKKNILDKNLPFVVQLFPDVPRKRILLVIDSPKRVNGLWEFYPESQKFNKLIKGNSFNHGNKIGNKIFFASRTNFYSFDCNDNKVVKQLTINYKNKVKNPNAQTVISPISSYRGFSSLFLMQNHKLCLISQSRLLLFPSGKFSSASFCFMPPEIEFKQPIVYYRKSKVYALPFRVTNIFPHSDGKSIIVIGQKNIFKVTPQIQ